MSVLPELPEPKEAWLPTHTMEYYDAKQMQDYAFAAIESVFVAQLPVAWILRRKADDFVRDCYATAPTADSLEFATLDGDYYTPLFDNRHTTLINEPI